MLLNLASDEYFKSVNVKQLAGRVITPVFQDEKNGKYKIISFYAKSAWIDGALFESKNASRNPSSC